MPEHRPINIPLTPPQRPLGSSPRSVPTLAFRGAPPYAGRMKQELKWVGLSVLTAIAILLLFYITDFGVKI